MLLDQPHPGHFSLTHSHLLVPEVQDDGMMAVVIEGGGGHPARSLASDSLPAMHCIAPVDQPHKPFEQLQRNNVEGRR